MKKLFYFGLEPLNERYTYQLCEEWIPQTFEKYKNINFIQVRGEKTSDTIKVGAVLDATGRGKYALSQCSAFLKMIENGHVNSGDIVYLQDFWTPGIESIFYALDLYGIELKFYAMLHAQSVDEYDFTHSMKNWMRHFELGLDRKLEGIFVASTIHKEQLRQAGFNSKIHVVSLPINSKMIFQPRITHKNNVVIYTSRLDKEKNPYFMLEVAKQFLKRNPNWEWHITTSGKEVKSNITGFANRLISEALDQPRLKIYTDLSKSEYYQKLSESKIHFNSSLQDYVSWTVLESSLFECNLVFPFFRSFPEFISHNQLYTAFNVESALNRLGTAQKVRYDNKDIVRNSDLGREIEAYIIATGDNSELNVWHEKEYCQQLLNAYLD